MTFDEIGLAFEVVKDLFLKSEDAQLSKFLLGHMDKISDIASDYLEDYFKSNGVDLLLAQKIVDEKNYETEDEIFQAITEAEIITMLASFEEAC